MRLRNFFRHEYWRLSKTHTLGLFLILPLWLTYEISAFRLNQSWLGGLRTGTDLLLKHLFSRLGMNVGIVMAILLAGLIAYISFNWQPVKRFAARPVNFGLVFLEILLYALTFGLVVGTTTGWLLSQNSGEFNRTMVASLVINLGSGVYEEFFFRLLLISGLLLLIKKIATRYDSQALNYGIAAVVSAFSFASFHHLAIFDEPLSLEVFLFRFFAGIAFSLLFIWRGFGITAYTHSLYNVFLMFR